MISSSQVQWQGMISKQGRGIDNADFGEVRDVNSDYVITVRGIINKEWFYIPKKEVQGYDNNKLQFRLTEEEAITQYLKH